MPQWFEIVSEEFEAAKRRYYQLQETGIASNDPGNTAWREAKTAFETLYRLREKLVPYK